MGVHGLVQLRRAIGHRLVHVQHGIEDLVLDLDEVERVLGDVLVGGADSGHGVAGVEHLVRSEHVVAHPLEGRERLTEVDHVAVDAREVGVRDDGLHAVERERLRGVDADDAGVRVRAALDAAVEHAWETHVSAVLGPAGHLVGAIGAHGAGADDLVFLIGRDHAQLLRCERTSVETPPGSTRGR